jgi:hypothetical protein
MAAATFLPWQSAYQRVRETFHDRKAPSDPLGWYQRVLQGAAPGSGLQGLVLELGWYLAGQPYVKVFPGVAQMMTETSIDIPASHLKAPFKTFAVLLPVEVSDLVGGVSGILVTHLSGRPGPGESTLSLSVQTAAHRANLSPAYGFMLSFADEALVETVLVSQLAETADGRQVQSRTGLSVEHFTRLSRIAICAMFFVLDRHEIVMPDWPRRKFEKMERAKARGDAVALSRYLGNYKEASQLTIGREVELPTPIVTGSRGEAAAPGSPLTHAHIRRGHLRMQPCGEGRSDRKLIFVPPSVIRPDLPFAVGGRGYKIPDRRE